MTITYPNLGNQGRLGNHLWQIASTLGLADEYGLEVEFNHWEYEPFFNVPADLFVDEPDGTPAWEVADHLPESERVYLQDFNIWAHMEDVIRHYFAPSVRSLEMLNRSEHDWFHELEQPVAVHVRRDERSYYQPSHPTPPASYYQQAIQMEKARLGDPTFVVFSDDIAWCKNHFPPTFKFVQSLPRLQDNYGTVDEPEWADYLDIFLMADCVGHIIPNSTFSWWGAFLSDNPQPIYPAVWYGPALKHIDWRLQIPPGWREVG